MARLTERCAAEEARTHGLEHERDRLAAARASTTPTRRESARQLARSGCRPASRAMAARDRPDRAPLTPSVAITDGLGERRTVDVAGATAPVAVDLHPDAITVAPPRSVRHSSRSSRSRCRTGGTSRCASPTTGRATRPRRSCGASRRMPGYPCATPATTATSGWVATSPRRWRWHAAGGAGPSDLTTTSRPARSSRWRQCSTLIRTRPASPSRGRTSRLTCRRRSSPIGPASTRRPAPRRSTRAPPTCLANVGQSWTFLGSHVVRTDRLQGIIREHIDQALEYPVWPQVYLFGLLARRHPRWVWYPTPLVRCRSGNSFFLTRRPRAAPRHRPHGRRRRARPCVAATHGPSRAGPPRAAVRHVPGLGVADGRAHHQEPPEQRLADDLHLVRTFTRRFWSPRPFWRSGLRPLLSRLRSSVVSVRRRPRGRRTHDAPGSRDPRDGGQRDDPTEAAHPADGRAGLARFENVGPRTLSSADPHPVHVSVSVDRFGRHAGPRRPAHTPPGAAAPGRVRRSCRSGCSVPEAGR